MRKAILTAAVMAVLVPAAVAGDKVDVEYNGNKERFDVGDLKTASVCGFKQQVASAFELKMRKFDLVENSRRLNEDKTLYAADVRQFNKLSVKEVSNSFQC